MNNKFQLTVIETANNISYEKPARNTTLIKDEAYDKIDRALSKVAITNAGTILVPKDTLGTLINAQKADANFIYEELSTNSKINISNKDYIKGESVVGMCYSRSAEHQNTNTRRLCEYTHKSLLNISTSDAVKVKQSDYQDYAREEEKQLCKKRKKEYSITHDEITGEPLKGNGEFHHIDKKAIYTDPVKRLDIDGGIVINKETHNRITKEGINNKEKLEEFKSHFTKI